MDSMALVTPRRASCNPFDIHEYEVGGFAGTIGHKLYLASMKGEDTDVAFQCGSDPAHVVEAHSPILKSESRVFRVMLGERWKAKTEEELKAGKILEILPEDDVEDFRSFLKVS